MIRRQFMKKVGQPIMPLFGRYMITFAVAILFLIAAAGVEAFISPVLMKSVVNSIQS
jgi:stage II sporulation protein M